MNQFRRDSWEHRLSAQPAEAGQRSPRFVAGIADGGAVALAAYLGSDFRPAGDAQVKLFNLPAPGVRRAEGESSRLGQPDSAAIARDGKHVALPLFNDRPLL